MAAQPGSEVYLALVKSTNPKQSKPDIALLSYLENEFPNVFPDSLQVGLLPDRGDAMKIETHPTANPSIRPVIHLSIAELDKLRKQLY
ncbi:hypothetical protein BGZ80_007898, partial [Entomortierella chlamydospora]